MRVEPITAMGGNADQSRRRMTDAMMARIMADSVPPATAEIIQWMDADIASDPARDPDTYLRSAIMAATLVQPALRFEAWA